MTFIHVVNTYTPPQPEAQARLRRAQSTWDQLRTAFPRMIVPCYRTSYGRSARSAIGDKRDVAFVRDVIDSAGPLVAAGEERGTIVVLTNADSCLVPSCLESLVECFGDSSICGAFSSRQDLDKIPRSWLTASDIKIRGTPHNGVDLVAVRWDWWNSIGRGQLVDVLMGYESWDIVFGSLIELHGGKRLDPLVYHELHELPYWLQFRRVAAGNLWNRKLAREWFTANGLFEKVCAVHPGIREY